MRVVEWIIEILYRNDLVRKLDQSIGQHAYAVRPHSAREIVPILALSAAACLGGSWSAGRWVATHQGCIRYEPASW
jgi:hypothetical protein